MKKRIFGHVTQTGAKLLLSVFALLLILTGCDFPTPTPPDGQEPTGTEQPTEPEEVVTAPNKEGDFDSFTAFSYTVYLNSFEEFKHFYRDTYLKYFSNSALMVDTAALNCKDVQYYFLCSAPEGLENMSRLFEIGPHDRSINLNLSIRNPSYGEIESDSPFIPFGDIGDSQSEEANPEWIPVTVCCQLDRYFSEEDFQSATVEKRQPSGGIITSAGYGVVLQGECLATLKLPVGLDPELEAELIDLLVDALVFMK